MIFIFAKNGFWASECEVLIFSNVDEAESLTLTWTKSKVQAQELLGTLLGLVVVEQWIHQSMIATTHG